MDTGYAEALTKLLKEEIESREFGYMVKYKYRVLVSEFGTRFMITRLG